MKKGLKNKNEYNLVKILSLLQKIDGFEKIDLNVYQDSDQNNEYFTEAKVLIKEDIYRKFDGTRGDGSTDVAVSLWADEKVNKKLRFCRKNAKVARTVILDPSNM